MKDYSAMSDFEINKQVAIIQGHKCYYDNGSYTNGYNKISVIVKGNGILGQFNPCNDPADAWPIITGSKIGVREYDGWWEARTYIPEHAICDKKPLRAAMIVYLQMNDK